MSGDISVSSAHENEDNLKQRYSITSHPTLPVLLCSDGYLMCVLRVQSSFATQPRLIRELMHETIGILNTVTDQLDHDHSLKQPPRGPLQRGASSDSVDNVPEWGLQTADAKSEKSSASDSGLDTNDGNGGGRMGSKSKSGSMQKIAEGKIIFSFLPQIEELSHRTIETSSVAHRLETAFEHLLSSWTLLVSMPTGQALLDQFECDQTAKSIQQVFTHFSHLLLLLDSGNLKQLRVYQNEFAEMYGARLGANEFGGGVDSYRARAEVTFEEEFKLKALIDLFIKMLRLLNFDPAAPYDPSSHMIVHVPRLVEKFVQSLVKFDGVVAQSGSEIGRAAEDSSSLLNPGSCVSRVKLLGLVYSLLNTCEHIVSSVYKFKQNDKFFLEIDSILGQRKPAKTAAEDSDDQANGGRDEASKNIKPRLLRRRTALDQVEFTHLLFEKCWFNLLHYAFKYRKTVGAMGTIRAKQIGDLDMLIILTQRRLQMFPTTSLANQTTTVTRPLKYAPIYRKGRPFNQL
jgi:hypothetical protein